jgi:hypothetical protein
MPEPFEPGQEPDPIRPGEVVPGTWPTPDTEPTAEAVKPAEVAAERRRRQRAASRAAA